MHVETPENQLQIKITSELETYIDELGEDEKATIINRKEEIIKMLMVGNFKDLGGLIAMRGFTYQFYVAMYYILEMLYDKKDNWWNAVVLEYFDDVALIGDNKIRFIQVKTVRERSHNKHTTAQFTTRDNLKSPLRDRDRFNSWLEKNFLNYDFFLEDKSFISGKELDKSEFIPQFEIVTNSPSVTLTDIDIFSQNVNFDMKTEIDLNNKFKKSILKPISISKNEKKCFADVAIKDIDFYLKRLYINKFGTSVELQNDILNMIQEILDLKDIRKASIAVYIFERLFADVIRRCNDDNEVTLNKANLVIGKEEIKQLIEQWQNEVKESLTVISYKDTAFGLFDKACTNLIAEFDREFLKQGLKNDLIETLGWFRESINLEIEKKPDYCIDFLNKLFNTNNTLTTRDFKDPNNEFYLLTSIKHIVYFLTFYSKKYIDYKESKLIFHIGESEIIQKVIISVYHARNQSSSVESKNRLVTTFNKNDIFSISENEIYCLVIGSKTSSVSNNQIAAKYMATTVHTKDSKILDVPDKVNFVNVEKFNEFFEGFKDESITLDTFLHDELLTDWETHIKSILERE